jgi:hypothetical protein
MRYDLGADGTPLSAREQFVGRRAVLIGLVAALLAAPAQAQKPLTSG